MHGDFFSQSLSFWVGGDQDCVYLTVQGCRSEGSFFQLVATALLPLGSVDYVVLVPSDDSVADVQREGQGFVRRGPLDYQKRTLRQPRRVEEPEGV